MWNEYTMNLLLIMKRLELSDQEFDAKYEEKNGSKSVYLQIDCEDKFNYSSVSFLICMTLVRRRGEWCKCTQHLTYDWCVQFQIQIQIQLVMFLCTFEWENREMLIG